MPDYGVRTVFTARNLLSPEMARMGRDVSKFGQRARSEFRSIGDVFKGSFAGTFAANVVSSGFGMMRRGVEGVTRDFITLDKTLNEAAVKFGDIEYGSEKFAQLSAVARQVGTTTKFSAIDAAGGLEALAAAGFASENALKILPSVANFAAAAKMDLASATQVAGEALNAFGMNAKDATTQTNNLVRISDVLAESDRMSNASMEQLAETVSYGAASFTNAGQSIETFGAMAAALADSAKHGSVAGTIMRGVAESFSNISPKAEKAFKKLLGPEFKKRIVDEKGNLRDFIDVLKEMEPALMKMGTAERNKTITDIFDVRAGEGVKSILAMGVDKAIQYRKQLEETSGTAERSGKQLTTSLGARIELMQNAFTEKGFQVFDKLLTGGTGKIDDMIAAVQKFDVTPIANGIKTVADAIAAIASHTTELKILGGVLLTAKGISVASSTIGRLTEFAGAMSATSWNGTPLGGAPSLLGAGGPVASSGMPSSRVGYNTGKIVMWGRGTVSVPSTGIPVDMPPEKAKRAGMNFANMAVGILEASGIGVTIGTAIVSALESGSKSLENERNALIRRFDSQAIELDSMSQMTPEQRRQLRGRISQTSKGLEEQWIGGTGNLNWSGMGKTLGAWFTGSDTPEELIAKAKIREGKLLSEFDRRDQAINAGFFDPSKINGQTQDPSAWIRALDKAAETKIVIELTGDGADKARVTNVTGTGETAPRVNKGKTGKQ